MPRQGIGLVRACEAAQNPAQIEWYRGYKIVFGSPVSRYFLGWVFFLHIRRLIAHYFRVCYGWSVWRKDDGA